MNSIITLTTDFGSNDAYVAIMKGVILSINPEVNIVDITHSIEPQNIPQAAFVVNSAYRYFPKQTVHMAIMVGFFKSFFQNPSAWGIGLAITFGSVWLACYRPPLFKRPWLWAVLVSSAILTLTAISFIQVPLQVWTGLALIHFWSQEVLVRWILLMGIPAILLSGLVQEGQKWCQWLYTGGVAARILTPNWDSSSALWPELDLASSKDSGSTMSFSPQDGSREQCKPAACGRWLDSGRGSLLWPSIPLPPRWLVMVWLRAGDGSSTS